jgi:hypothetical protein
VDLGGEFNAYLWTLHIRSNGTKELYVSCMLSESLGVGDRTESASLTASHLDQRERAAADNLFTECSGSFPAAPPQRVVRGMSLRASSVLHVTHALGWEGQPDYSRLVLTREVVDGTDKGSRAAEVRVADLSESGKAAVGVLDRLGAATSRRLVDATIMRLSGTTAPDSAPHEPLDVFISYRFQDHQIATLLYDAFVAYGNHAFFRPYLDAHDLPAGELKRRLQQAIAESDIVVAVATRSYAAPGSWSSAEVGMATSARVPIIPVLFADERPASWPNWKDYVTHRFANADEMASNSRAFGRLADLCLRTGARTAPGPTDIPDAVMQDIEAGRVLVTLRIDAIELSATDFNRGDKIRVFVRASASPIPITRVRVCYGRVGTGVFRACPEMQLVSGTGLDGEWSGTFDLDRGWPPGDWVLQQATIENGLGFGSSVDPGDWTRQGGGGSGFKAR